MTISERGPKNGKYGPLRYSEVCEVCDGYGTLDPSRENKKKKSVWQRTEKGKK